MGLQPQISVSNIPNSLLDLGQHSALPQLQLPKWTCRQNSPLPPPPTNPLVTVRHQGQELTPSEVAGLEETQHRLLKTKKCWFSAIIERFGFSLQAADLSLKLLLACATQRGTLCCQRHSIPVIKSDKKRERKKKKTFSSRRKHSLVIYVTL